eukprot:9503094-Pyramimonas_sp.AAC.1
MKCYKIAYVSEPVGFSRADEECKKELEYPVGIQPLNTACSAAGLPPRDGFLWDGEDPQSKWGRDERSYPRR